jgi:hypothetical protein
LAPNNDGWWDHIYDNAKEDGLAKGFHIDDISFSGFWSQGDGASWEGTVDMVKWLEVHKADDPKATILFELIADNWVEKHVGIIKRNNYYSHSNTMTHCGWSCVSPNDDSVIETGILQGANVSALIESIDFSCLDDLLDDMLESARDYANDIYNQLRKEYEYLCSEEVIAELCDANDYLFTEDGKHFV